MTKEDVIRLVAEGVSDDIVMERIDATHSRFDLAPQDVEALVRARVDYRVVNHMLRTALPPEKTSER